MIELKDVDWYIWFEEDGKIINLHLQGEVLQYKYAVGRDL